MCKRSIHFPVVFKYLMKKFVIIGLEIKKSSDFGLLGGFCSIAQWYHRPHTKIAAVTKNWSLGGSFSKLYMMISPINQDEHTAELSIT